MGLMSFIKGVFNKPMNNTPKQIKSIFDLSEVPSFRDFYINGIAVWKQLYKGHYSKWHDVPSFSIEGGKSTRQIETLCTAKAVASEIASLIWAEECQVNVSTRGFVSDEQHPDKLVKYVKSVLVSNNFAIKTRELIEQAEALGGAAYKVWVDKDSVKLGYCMSDQFIPLSWSNADITEGVFITQQTRGGNYYTLLEFHKWNGAAYTVVNKLYKAKSNSDVLLGNIGESVPLSELYPTLAEETPIQGLKQSLFSYFRTNIANNLDDNSPLGVSVYANALSTLKALDICYDSFIREFVLGKKRIIVPANAVRTVVDKASGKPCRYFDANDEAYVALASDDLNSLEIKDNSVELRVDEHEAAINAFLGILSFQLGLSAGSLTFDKAEGLKTATEVISEKSKTYKTIRLHQEPLKQAIEKLVHNIVAVSILYDIDFEGESVEKLTARGYDVNIIFDDSIINDRQTNITEGVTLVNNGLMSKTKFMTEKLGYTTEQATAEIELINNEGKTTAVKVEDLMLNET